MGIFKKTKRVVKPQAVMAKAPEEKESVGEIKHIEELSSTEGVTAEQPRKEIVEEIVQKEEEEEKIMYREVPVCMSQVQINNLVIENNIMLKQIVAEID